MNYRVGIGYDIHRLESGLTLTLGGCIIPFDRGTVGHSDGDVLIHSLIDALLGACSLGDIGTHFPDTDPQYKNAESTHLLQQTYFLVKSYGYRIHNIDANIIAEKPKLMPYIETMKQNISKVLSIHTNQVSIKAKTSEGITPIGELKAIESQTVVLVVETDQCGV